MGKIRTFGTKSGIIGCVKAKPIKGSQESVADSFPSNQANYGASWRKFKRNRDYQDSERKAKRRLCAVSIYALGLGICCLLGQVDSAENNGEVGVVSKVNVTDGDEDEGDFILNCTSPSANDFPSDLFSMDDKRHGAILVHFIVSVYLFYAVLLICDEYFVPSVESICRHLKIPSDVAGATFMAVSTSAPELFTNVIGTFVTKGDLGVGTIVGSAVFNILAVGACCGLGAGFSLYKLSSGDDKLGVRLEWWPLTRDSFFYLISVGALITVLYNRKVFWIEALAMIVIYGFYVIVLCYNTKCQRLAEKFIKWITGLCSMKSEEEPRRISIVVSKVVSANENTPLLLKVSDPEKSPPRENNNLNGVGKVSHLDLIPESQDELLISNALTASNSYAQLHEIDNCWGWCKLPQDRNWRTLIEFIISWPIRFAMWLTIPDCRVHRFRKWYWLTLILCVAWIGTVTYVISWMVTIIGDTLSIPDSVTGLTFLAAGTSIPEVISSLIVARQGLGAMAFSNTIGSNTFDLLICLGLPWLIETLILTSTSSVSYIEIHSGGLEYSAMILVSALLLLYFAIAWNGFILDKKLGVSCVIMYIVFITFACMLEMNVFFPVNLPTCQ